MSDQPLDPQRGRLDRAIERAVRRLISRDAPADLRARVLERLAEPARPRSVWTPGRLALAGATVALAGIAVLIVPRLREQAPAPQLASQTAAGAAAQPAAPPRPPEPVAQIAQGFGAPSRTAPPRRPPARLAEAATATARSEDFLVIDPLPTPGPIRIEPLEGERVTAVPLDITPLQFETVQIEPLRVSQ